MHGLLHRDNDLPAVIWANGLKQWYQHGEQHRDNDQPAEIYANGSRFWYHRGKAHRDNSLPAGINADGSTAWYYQHNELHRVGGPALKTDYYIDGNKVTKEFNDRVVALYTKYNQYVPGYGWVPRRFTYRLRDAILRHILPRIMEEGWAEIAAFQNHD